MENPAKENPSSIAETSQENPSSIAETSQENPPSIAATSQENPSSIAETSQENPPSIAETSQENPSSIAETSQENPSSIAETSQENPSSIADHSEGNPSTNFSFKVHPAIKLKQTLVCLTEKHFNPVGLGVIEVGEVGLEITVGLRPTNVSQLWLIPTGLIDFKYSKPFKKWVNLRRICHLLVDAADTDTITFHHLDGSNQLVISFGSGNDEPIQFSEEIAEVDEDGYVKLPRIRYACEAVVLSEHLLQMIATYEAAEHKLVTVDISDEHLDIFVGVKNWSYSYENRAKMDGIRGMMKGQGHHFFFEWRDCELLKKAALVAPGFLLCLNTDPPQSIMLRFNLRELGDFVYLQKSSLTVFNSPLSDDVEVELGHLADITKAASLV